MTKFFPKNCRLRAKSECFRAIAVAKSWFWLDSGIASRSGFQRNEHRFVKLINGRTDAVLDLCLEMTAVVESSDLPEISIKAVLIRTMPAGLINPKLK